MTPTGGLAVPVLASLVVLCGVRLLFLASVAMSDTMGWFCSGVVLVCLLAYAVERR